MQVPVLSVDGQEADDIAATLVTRCLCRGGRAVVCTTDKDYYQLICKDVAAWSKDKYHKPADVEEKLGITTKQVVDFLCLTGKDDVPSAKGIGAKTAVELLRKHNDFVGIYDRRESLTQVKRESIEEFAPNYWMARTCHTLARNVELDFDWGSTHCLD
jgi:5'-3' exonuclease